MISSVQSIDYITKAFQRGTNATDTMALGFIGTSMQGITPLINRGRLKPITGLNPDQHAIYFNPNPNHPYFSRLRILSKNVSTATLQSAYQDAVNQAQSLSRQHILAQFLNMSLEIGEYASDINSLWNLKDKIIRKYAYILKIEYKHISQAVKKAKAMARAGIVLAIHENVQKFRQIEPGENGGAKIIAATGLSEEFILGIEPLGDEEWDFLSTHIYGEE